MNKLPEHNNRKEIPEYHIWKAMRARCSSKCNSESKYQLENIKVCDRWNDFVLFYEDMGPRPTKKHSIDRINNDGNYEPNNCKWANQQEQCSNRGSFNNLYTYNDKAMVLKEWARELNINYSTLNNRIFRDGMTFEEAVTYKSKRGIYEFKGEEKTVAEWAKEYNLKPSTISDRLRKGWDIERALTTELKVR